MMTEINPIQYYIELVKDKDELIKKLRKEIRRLKNRSPDAVIRGMK